LVVWDIFLIFVITFKQTIMINEETHPHIAELLNTNLHSEVVDKLKLYLKNEERLSKNEIIEKIDICYDSDNIPSTIYIDDIRLIVEDVNDLERYLDKHY